MPLKLSNAACAFLIRSLKEDIKFMIFIIDKFLSSYTENKIISTSISSLVISRFI